MFGYAAPCSSPSATKPMLLLAPEAVEQLAGVTYVDIAGLLGGNAETDTASSMAYFSDPIHPNRAGFEKIFEVDGIDAFFGCSGPQPP